jgi:hypothetical protein
MWEVPPDCTRVSRTVSTQCRRSDSHGPFGSDRGGTDVLGMKAKGARRHPGSFDVSPSRRTAACTVDESVAQLTATPRRHGCRASTFPRGTALRTVHSAQSWRPRDSASRPCDPYTVHRTAGVAILTSGERLAEFGRAAQRRLGAPPSIRSRRPARPHPLPGRRQPPDVPLDRLRAASPGSRRRSIVSLVTPGAAASATPPRLGPDAAGPRTSSAPIGPVAPVAAPPTGPRTRR